MKGRGVVLALLLAALAIAVQYRRFQDPHVVHDRWDLPAFDAYAYVAMAERPAVFTVAPWGYRVLTPALVHVLPGNAVRGFRDHMFGGLVLASALLYVFLRRLGHGEGPALLATAAFALSPAVAEVVRYPFLVEPLTVALQIAFLLALASGWGVPTLALVALLGALSKELSLMLVPLVFFVRLPMQGWRRAALATVGVAAPAAAATLILRLYWVPHIEGPTMNLGLSTLQLVAARLLESWRETLSGLLLAGLTPIAAVGAFTPAARPFLRRYGYLLAVTLALPLVAWINIGGPRPMAFFGPNTLRLLLFALPGLLALALFALHRVWPHHTAPPPPGPPSHWREGAAAVLVLAGLGGLLFGFDRYRRVDLRGFRDGPLVLALSRESLRTARRLANGNPVTWDPQTSRYAWGLDNPREMDRMRWFLRDGWGERPHYGVGEMTTVAPRASFLLPLLAPQPVSVTLSLRAPAEGSLALFANGRPAGHVAVGRDARETTFALPPAALFRGDNVVSFEAVPGTTILRITLRP